MNIVEKSISERSEQEFRNGVSNDDAKKALGLLLKWIGDDPEREGLKETPFPPAEPAAHEKGGQGGPAGPMRPLRGSTGPPRRIFHWPAPGPSVHPPSSRWRPLPPPGSPGGGAACPIGVLREG